MALVLEPKLNRKLNKAISWVPSFNIGHVKNNENFSPVQPLFGRVGPLCTMAMGANWASSSGQAPVYAEFQAACLMLVSAHEYLQLIQIHTRKETRMFDFRDQKKSLLACRRVADRLRALVHLHRCSGHW